MAVWHRVVVRSAHTICRAGDSQQPRLRVINGCVGARRWCTAPTENWCHPFKDTQNPLSQLTHLANAKAGYFPLGRSGLFHGGIHFDSGTAETLDQSSVHCLADGEVVAYRIDTQAPTTAYFIDKQTVEKPFSRNFVLVRHRLQPPKIKGSPDTPPSLTVYSLYMHLQDWSVYHEDATLARPAFWPESPIRRVKQTVNDVRPGNLELRGLNVRTQDREGKVIDLLPRGAEVTVSGEGHMRKLENSLGPANLISADGSLRGYVSLSEVMLIAGDDYYVKALGGSLNVYAEPDFHSEVLMELPNGTRFTLSGDSNYRKLERIDQYVHFAALQGEQKPLGPDRVVVLDTPVAIKAGELIGHLGRYQESGAEQPEQKLHLEVFSGDDVDSFIKASRAWAKRLPEKDRTWLKLAMGTAVVPHQENATAALLKVWSVASPLSAADLLIPKSVLDDLPADRKIQVTASESRKASHWYRLDGLLHGADNHLLNGWVREEVGVTPWVSPWSWEGYDIIDEYDVPQEFMASFLRAVKRLSEAQLERFGPMADEGDTGPLKTRLYDIIDTDRNGRMTAEELRTALSLPAHAQSISQLIVNCESEWYHKPGKWDRLDEVLGHSGSTPHLNWLAEKQRIRQMCWWGEVAAGVGLPAHGEVYYFHPVGLVANFLVKDECACGCCFGAKFMSTRYGQQYGPVYWGNLKLADFKAWDDLVNTGMVTMAERIILVAMSENEGNLDALQSYDSEILTAGAMQKTINPQGAGELPVQVYEFKQKHPDLYQSLFADCGWEVKTENRKQYLYYDGVTGSELKVLLRQGFNQTSFESKEKLISKPLAVFAHAINTSEYIVKQVLDFVQRLRASISISPSGYNLWVVGDYVRSNFGRSVVLDHHVNRPGNVAGDFGTAVKTFLINNPTVSENPADWGEDHAKHEAALLEIYGPTRRMTDADLRYQSLKGKL